MKSKLSTLFLQRLRTLTWKNLTAKVQSDTWNNILFSVLKTMFAIIAQGVKRDKQVFQQIYCRFIPYTYILGAMPWNQLL